MKKYRLPSKARSISKIIDASHALLLVHQSSILSSLSCISFFFNMPFDFHEFIGRWAAEDSSVNYVSTLVHCDSLDVLFYLTLSSVKYGWLLID
jgi:hypothetical protein